MDERFWDTEWANSVQARTHACWRLHTPNRRDPASTAARLLYHNVGGSETNAYLLMLLDFLATIPIQLAPPMGTWISDMREENIKERGSFNQIDDYCREHEFVLMSALRTS